MAERIRKRIAHALYMTAMKVDPADDTLLAFNPEPIRRGQVHHWQLPAVPP